MAIKYTVQGLLLYLTMAAYLLGFVTALAGRRKIGQMLFVAGFFVAAGAFAYRWYDVRHVPLQNLFEVFLFLGVACYPISWFCRRVLRIGGEAADMLIAGVVVFPAGFVFHAEPMQLPPALQSWLFAPHVMVYMLAYIVMGKAAFWAWMQLATRSRQPVRLLTQVGALSGVVTGIGFSLFEVHRHGLHPVTYILARACLYVLVGALVNGVGGAISGRLVHVSREPDMRDAEPATYELVAIGFPLLTLGLILGSWWGKLAWGNYWGWDPKELWSLASWLVYLGYFHWRYMFGKKHAHLNSLWAIAGMVAIIITLLWVNLSQLFPGLHSYAT